MNKEKKIVIHCTLCKEKIYTTEEEIKSQKFYNQYIIRHGTDNALTAVQAGTICEACSKLPIEKRVILKR